MIDIYSSRSVAPPTSTKMAILYFFIFEEKVPDTMTNLALWENTNAFDIIIQVRLLEANGETREKVGKTSIQFRTNSVFNSVFTCKEITSAELLELSVNLSLHSQDHFGQNHFFGGVIIKLSDVTFDPSEPTYFWRPVQRKVRNFYT